MAKMIADSIERQTFGQGANVDSLLEPQRHISHPALGQELTPSHTKGRPQFTRSTAQSRVLRRVSTERTAYNRQCHRLGGHSLPGSQSRFFLRFSMWHLPQRLHINGVS